MLDKQDLLFAHATLCDFAHNHTSLDLEFANRLCVTINNFQKELKFELIPDAKDFQVIMEEFKFCSVSPIGGWNVQE